MLNQYSTHTSMKLRGRIVTVDPATRRVEAVLKDYGLVQVAVYEIGAHFRWPKEGETWTLLRDGTTWTLGMPDESEDSSLSVTDLEPGDTMIGADGAKVHIKGELVATLADDGTVEDPENIEGSLFFSQGRRITFRHSLGRYSIDALNGDMRFFTENSDGTGGIIRGLLTRSGDFTITGGLTATGNISTAGTLTATGNITTAGTLTTTGNITTNQGTLHIPSSAVAARFGASYAKANQQEFLQTWNATDGQDWSLYRPGGTRNLIFYSSEIAANLLTLASTGISVRGGITLGEGWASGSSLTPKYFEFPGITSGTMKRRWFKNTIGDATNRRLSLFNFSRDTANWMPSAGYFITIRAGYYAGGSVTHCFVGGSWNTPAFIHVISATGPTPIVPKLGAAVTISGTIVRNEVYVDIPNYILISVEVEYGAGVSEVTSTPTGTAQVQFTGTETTLGSDPGSYTGYLDIQNGINFRTAAQATSDTYLYRSATATLTLNGKLITTAGIDVLGDNVHLKGAYGSGHLYFGPNATERIYAPSAANLRTNTNFTIDGSLNVSGADINHTGSGLFYTSGSGIRTNNSQGNLHLDGRTPGGGMGGIYLNWYATGDVIFGHQTAGERARVTAGGDLKFNTLRGGVIGVYDPANTQAVWAMGPAYVLDKGNASNNYGNFYGLAWSYNPDYGTAGTNPQSKSGLNHQLLLMQAGQTTFAAGEGVWTRGTVRVQPSAAATGSAEMTPGTTNNAGYFSWHTPNRTRQAYMGFNTDNTGVTFQLEQGTFNVVAPGGIRNETIMNSSGVSSFVARTRDMPISKPDVGSDGESGSFSTAIELSRTDGNQMRVSITPSENVYYEVHATVWVRVWDASWNRGDLIIDNLGYGYGHRFAVVGHNALSWMGVSNTHVFTLNKSTTYTFRMIFAPASGTWSYLRGYSYSTFVGKVAGFW